MTKPDKTAEESAVELDESALDEAQGGSEDPENRYRVKVQYIQMEERAEASKIGFKSD